MSTSRRTSSKIKSKTLRLVLYSFSVGVTGIEPAHLAVLDPKSSASANSATPPKTSPDRKYQPPRPCLSNNERAQRRTLTGRASGSLRAIMPVPRALAPDHSPPRMVQQPGDPTDPPDGRVRVHCRARWSFVQPRRVNTPIKPVRPGRSANSHHLHCHRWGNFRLDGRFRSAIFADRIPHWDGSFEGQSLEPSMESLSSRGERV